jgi:hypothetical protein
MSMAFMRKKGKLKLPEDVCQKLRLREGDRVSVFWSMSRGTFALFPHNVDPAEFLKIREPSQASVSREEVDALLKWHRGRLLTRAEKDIVIRVLNNEEEAEPEDEDEDEAEAEAEAEDRNEGEGRPS